MTSAEPSATAGRPRTTVATRGAGWALGGLAAIFLALAGLYAWAVPPLEGFDAIAHFRAVVYLRAHPRPYVLNAATLDASYELITQPPLYHTLAALAAAPWPPAPAQALVEAISNPYFEKGLSDRQTLTLPNAPPDALALLWAARAVSLLGALLAVGATWLLARTLVPQSWTFALAVASVVALNPVFLYLAVSVTNDAWAAGTTALTVALAVRCAVQLRPPRCWFWAGAAGGLALLAKYSGFLAGLPALVALALYASRQAVHAQDTRARLTTALQATLQAAGWASLGGTLVAGYWYGRNLWLYGELAPLGRMAGLIPSLNRPEPWPWPVVVEYLPWLVWSYWGVFVATIAPAAFLETVRVGMAAGLAGLLPALLRRDGQQYAAKGWTVLLAAVWSLAAAAAVIHWTRTVSYGEQGRLAHIAAPALALLWVMGWQAWLPARWRPALHLIMAAGMAGLALWAAQALYQAYRLPPPLTSPPQPDRPLNVRFAGGPVLLGVDFPTGAALAPGSPLPLTLYWTTEQVIPENYTLFLHLADPQDRLLYQFDGLPAQGRHPTRQWQPGEVFADAYTIQAASIPTPGLATLSLGLYPYADPSQRLAVTDASGAPLGDRVILAKVRLHPEAAAPQPANDGAGLAEWANGIRLVQAEVKLDEAGQPSGVHLVWQSAATLHQDFTLFVQALDRENRLLVQVDQQPQAGQWPTSTWRAGDEVPDHLELSPAAGQRLDGWQQIIVGWYDTTGRRLPLAAPEVGRDYVVLAERQLP
ncbi:MAG TPA: glycosyltransferase family 39 protein [Caldilineaceae bacterium]|nr:glycosyltransferase family 39 protein [Caldilineaceae bacterium]